MTNQKLLETSPRLVTNVSRFLKKKLIYGKKICLGYSGGIDSTALLHILQKCQRFVDFSLSIAHVNHGWRIESNYEADQIKKFSQENKLQLYLHTIPKQNWETNIEDRYRKERMRFFQRLYRENNFDILFLAHHAQDRAETVLKRILEGSSLHKIAGIKEETFYYEMPIYRPLISINKNDLLHYVKDYKLIYFEDNTNYDQKYLRSRMRQTLFPLIEKHFQKGILKNLLKLADRCQILEEYLQKRTEKFYKGIRTKGGCIIVDFSSFDSLERIEVDFFLRSLLASLGVTLSSSQIFTVLTCLIENKYDKSTRTKDFTLRIHGKILYIEPI